MMHSENSWRQFLVLSLFIGLAIYFRAFLITNVFEPIAMLFWAAWRIVISVHQNIYWMILILIGSLLMIRSFAFRRNASGIAYSEVHNPVNRVEDWLRLMKNASPGQGQSEYLRDSLKRLHMSIQQVERFHSMKLDETVMTETSLLPAAVHRFLFPPERRHKMFAPDYRLQRLFLIPKPFRERVSRVLQIENIEIEETLTWMESVMEINNDQ